MRPRRTIFRRWKALWLAVLCAAIGCTSPASQLRQCQQEKEQLLAAIQKQRQTSQALREKVASLEERLDQAEKALARGDSSTRLSSRPPPPPTAVEGAFRSPAASPSADSALPWRAPTTKSSGNAAPQPSGSVSPQPPSGQKPEGGKTTLGEDARTTSSSYRQPPQGQGSVRPAATMADEALPRGHQEATGNVQRVASHAVHQILARDPRCEYDRQVGAYRVRLPLSFRESATLTAQSKQRLDELARWLNRPELRDVRVLVAGYVEGRPSSDESQGRRATARELSLARAAAVADYLDRHGIAHERLGVSAVGSRGPLGQVGQAQNASGEVQIFLVEPDAPVIGWGPTGQALRR